jgi:hypothetical protein
MTEAAREPTLEQMRRVWLGHPAYGDGPGLTREEASDLYTAQGLDSSHGAMRAGQSYVVYRIGNERWRGDGTQGMMGHGDSKYAHTIAEWVEAARGQEVIQGDLLADLEKKIPDGRYRREALLTFRLGQSVFRNELLGLYDRQCWISGCRIERVLQAAHIEPHSGSNNQPRRSQTVIATPR